MLCLRVDVVSFIEFGLHEKEIYLLSCLFLILPRILPMPDREETEKVTVNIHADGAQRLVVLFLLSQTITV